MIETQANRGQPSPSKCSKVPCPDFTAGLDDLKVAEWIHGQLGGCVRLQSRMIFILLQRVDVLSPLYFGCQAKEVMTLEEAIEQSSYLLQSPLYFSSKKSRPWRPESNRAMYYDPPLILAFLYNRWQK